MNRESSSNSFRPSADSVVVLSLAPASAHVNDVSAAKVDVWKEQKKYIRQQHFILGGKTQEPREKAVAPPKREERADAVVREKDLFRKEPNFPYLTPKLVRLFQDQSFKVV